MNRVVFEINKEDFFFSDQDSNKEVWLKAVLKSYDKKLGELTYVFCDDQQLLKINKETLRHDTYTDIISFDGTIGNIVSGDIYISIDRVKENAFTFGELFEDELLRVMSHGVLHFCGFSDKTKEAKKIMTHQENKAIEMYYNLINVPRGTKIK